jgi:YD repeat-containing protein
LNRAAAYDKRHGVSSGTVNRTNQVVGTGTRRFTYDFRGQMRSLTDTNSTAYAYEFDGDGNRRKETIAGTTRKFIYDGPNVLMELNHANTIEAVYVHGPGMDQPIEKISYVGGAADGRTTRGQV